MRLVEVAVKNTLRVLIFVVFADFGRICEIKYSQNIL